MVGVGFIGLFATMSCATSGAKMNLVRNRAVFDLGCDSLHVVDLGGNTFGVRGCGTQASYVVVCGGDRTAIHQCTAVLNSQPVRAMP